MQETHTDVADLLRQVVESVLLGDWRTTSQEQLQCGAAHLRTIKARYISTHLGHGLPMQPDLLGALDGALTGMYLLLDRLEGRNLAIQETVYRALQEAQAPLLLACAMIPSAPAVPTVAEMGDALQLESETVPVHQHQPAASDMELPVVHDVSPEQEESDEAKGSTQEKQFRWTKELTTQLKAALDEADTAGKNGQPVPMNRVIAEIANRFHWPVNAVTYKVYALRQRQQREQHEPPETTSKEGDRSEGDTIIIQHPEGEANARL